MLNGTIVIGAAVLWIVLPGLALAAITFRDPEHPGWVAGRAFAFGLACWLLGTQALARTVGLTPVSVWIASALLGAASLAVLARQSNRDALWAARRELLWGTAAVVLAIGVWFPVLYSNVQREDTLLQSTPWYYWLLSQQTADAGHLPSTTREWGSDVPFLADYPAFTTGTAALSLQSDQHKLAPSRIVMFLAVTSSGLGVALLARAWGASPTTSLAAIPFLFALEIFTTKYSSYRPEAFGHGLAFLAAAFAVEWLRRRRRIDLVAGGVAFVSLGQVHGVVLVLCVLLVAATVGALLPTKKTALKSYVGAAALMGAGWSIAWAAWTLVLNGALSGTEQASSVLNRGGLEDPTWRFVTAISADPPSLPPSWQDIVGDVWNQGFLGLDSVVHKITLGVVLSALVLTALVGGRARRPAIFRFLVFSGLTLLGILAVSGWFELHWQSYVPRRLGFRRLLQLAIMFVPLGIAVAIPRRGAARAVAGAVVTVFALVVTINYWQSVGDTYDQRPDSETLTELRALQLPSDSFVLANAYTEGFLPGVLHVEGLLDGRAPYTYPDLLLRSLDLLQGAAQFYAQPSSHVRFLTANHITHVIAVDVGKWTLGTSNVFPVDKAGLAGLSQLEPVLQGPHVTVYRVRSR